MIALIPWWVVVQVSGLAALPLTLSLFRRLPDRGYPFARVLGILLPSFLAWFLGMWQLVTYGPGTLVVCVIAIAALSGVILWKDRTIVSFLKERWRLVVGYETLFAVMLLGGALLRVYSEWGGVAINHTEQPMDFAFLNGIIRSRTLPPQDPWLSGYSINYYYFGYFQCASLTLLSGIPSSVTFNLHLALLFALAVTGCFSLGYNMTLLTDGSARRRAVVAGTLAALFTVAVGNQMGALQLIAGSRQVAPLNAGEVWTVLSARLRGEKGDISLGHTVYTPGEFGDDFDSIHLSTARQIDDFDWWWPSRVLWDERPSENALERFRNEQRLGEAVFRWRRLVQPQEIGRYYTISEFPFFSFFLGDMHPHVMSIPLTLLAVSLSLNLLVSPEGERPTPGSGPWFWVFLTVTAVVLGGLYLTNSWDFPTYLLLYGAAWVWRRRRDTSQWSREAWKALGQEIGLLVLLCVLLYLPFYLTFHSLVGNKTIPEDVFGIPVVGWIAARLSKVFQTVGPVLWDKTSLNTFLIIFGLFLYPALTWLGVRAAKQRKQKLSRRWVGLAVCTLIGLLGAIWLRFALLLFLPVLWIAWSLLSESEPVEAVALLVLLLTLTIAIGCDLVYIRDIYESRMNTIFKFYYQIWMLLAIVGAWAIAQAGRAYLRRRLPLYLWAVPLALLLLGGLVFPVMTLRNGFTHPPTSWTLDGIAHLQREQPADHAGIQWLWENAEPDAVILEAVGSDWGYNGRVSAATGLPTLLGWDGHELQWRGGHLEAIAEIDPRREAARRIYETTNVQEAQQLLQQYSVDYVFFGTLEGVFGPETRAKFDQIGALVFEDPTYGTRIYRIERQD